MFGEGINRENNKDHISQSRGFALDGKKHIGEWTIVLGNHYAWLQTRWWRMHERQINSWGSEKSREWRIALSNHYAWLQTHGWRMHE